MRNPDHRDSLDFLCISTTGWDEIWGSRQQIMLRLAKAGHRVLFVERQIGPEHILKHPERWIIKHRLRKLQSPELIVPNLWLWKPPLTIPGRYYSFTLNDIGQYLLASQIQIILKNLGFGNIILWIYPPQSAPLVGKFQEKLVIYHCIERYAGEQSGLKRRVMLRQEEALLKKVDLVFVHSEGLKKLYKSLTKHPIIYISSAADVEHYQSTESIHPIIESIPRPRLVLLGTLDSRIDLQLLMNIVLTRPEWNLILIGSITSHKSQFSALVNLPNVHHLGKQPFDILPSLLNGVDICLIPYQLSEMTRYVNPLKAYEYLAAGKPILSVDLPELANLSEWITIVRKPIGNNQEYGKLFVSKIEEALSKDTTDLQKLRRLAAHKHSWDERTVEMLNAVHAARALKRSDLESS